MDTDQDVDELQRIATILNPASVIPLIPAPAGRLFDAHWRVFHSSPRSRKEHITVLEARALDQSVSVVGRRARGHATRVLVLSDSLSVILASTKERSSRREMCRALRSTAATALYEWTLACHVVGPFRGQRR